jgi:hypothetical protein
MHQHLAALRGGVEKLASYSTPSKPPALSTPTHCLTQRLKAQNCKYLTIYFQVSDSNGMSSKADLPGAGGTLDTAFPFLDLINQREANLRARA